MEPTPTSHSPFTIPHSPFPLTLSLATILTTGLALIAAAANLQWSIAAPDHDSLNYAWLYVNIALLWTTLALWPALALSRPTLSRLDFPVLFIAAIPALAVAAFLSNITLATALATLAIQFTAALFALGLMSWRTLIPAPLIAGLLASLAVILPLLAYLWAEFLPLAPQSWLALTPMLALTHAATAPSTPLLWWTAALYALPGAALLTTAPRRKSD